MKKENKFSSVISHLFTMTGAFVYNISYNQFAKAGWPDLIIEHSKYHGYLELKVDDYELNSLQEAVIRGLNLKGTNAFVMHLFTNVVDKKKLSSYAIKNLRIEDTISYIKIYGLHPDKSIGYSVISEDIPYYKVKLTEKDPKDVRKAKADYIYAILQSHITRQNEILAAYKESKAMAALL